MKQHENQFCSGFSPNNTGTGSLSHHLRHLHKVMDFHKLISRYQQFGGLRLVREYARLGMLWPIVKAVSRRPIFAFYIHYLHLYA